MKTVRKKETIGSNISQYLTKSKERNDKHSISDLPVDLIIEILTKLPPRSLSKLICVSKLWSSIIKGKHFTDLYLTRSSTRPLLLYHRYCYATKITHYSSDQENPSSVDSTITLPGFQISPPVRGLICCEDNDFNAVIGNPSTGQFLTLPKADNWLTKRIFFGYDPVNDQYKVLCMRVIHDRIRFVCERYQVLTLGAQESWRVIECKHPNYPQSQGICQNGVIYYVAGSLPPDVVSVIVSFDLRFEEFSLITLPEDVPIGPTDEFPLVSHKEKIAWVNVSSNGKFELWVLMDVKKQEWTKVSFVIPFWDGLVGNYKFFFLRNNKFRCVGTISTGELLFEPCYTPFQVFCSLLRSQRRQG